MNWVPFQSEISVISFFRINFRIGFRALSRKGEDECVQGSEGRELLPLSLICDQCTQFLLIWAVTGWASEEANPHYAVYQACSQLFGSIFFPFLLLSTPPSCLRFPLCFCEWVGFSISSTILSADELDRPNPDFANEKFIINGCQL